MNTPISRRASLAGLAGAVTGGALLATGPASAAPAKPKPKPASAADLAAMATVATVADLRTTPGAADGQQVQLLGYAAQTPGRGGGTLHWDADATEADDGGTVFAVTGVATGRWKRPYAAHLDLTWFGWTGLGDGDDGPKVRAAIAALPEGGVIEAGPGIVRIASTVRVASVPIVFQGAGHTDDLNYATQYLVATGTGDGFVLAGVHGGGFRDLAMRGENLTGGFLIRTEANGTTGNYMVDFSNVRFRDGYNGIALRACNTFRFRDCVWNGFTGQQVILFNGVGDTTRADPIEFVQCAISAGSGHDNTDNVVIDGLGGSTKFIATAILFGRNGLWMRNTTGQTMPKFVYFEGGGFENGKGTPVLLDAGAQMQITNTYISCDGEQDDIRINPGFTGSATISNSIIRGTGRNGIDIGSTRVTVTGCLIGNNGRTANAAFARTITNAAANPDGKVRLTTAAAHGWETDDRISIQGVAGTTEANGKWGITVVNDTQFDLPEVAFAHVYAGAGTAFRNGAGINIRESASRVVVVGNAIGSLADGVNRQDYGVVSAASDVLVADNDLDGNTVGPYEILGTATAQTRFAGNKGVDQVDGWLTASVAGAIADGGYDFPSMLYLDGQRIQVTRVTRKLGAGTCTVELVAGGTGAGALSATSTLQTTKVSAPSAVDGASGAKRLQVRVAGATGASDLEVQFGYQTLG
ncbi:hypothetical protein GCM10023322_78160 [Rugosimonospora acidiphila]|uniref:Right handed beta helix region n=1 Tax=Rugosimonospora acidiphila TaxID=556531 RepID=A0ABP9SSC5_9ACTN